MDHYATRYPTNVVDIANFLVRLSGESEPCSYVGRENTSLTGLFFLSPSIPSNFDLRNKILIFLSFDAFINFVHNISAKKEFKKTATVPPILHYSAAEPFTKYEMCLVFAKILNLPHGHIVPDSEVPKGDSATTRPKDCQLYTKETEDLGVEGGLGLSLFEEWWTEYLRK